VDQHFCVASGAENVAAKLELMTQLGMVENIARRYEEYLTVFICDRLTNAFYIGDIQPDMREANSWPGVESVTIRSPVPDRRGHTPQ
jgi:hypothetical protein